MMKACPELDNGRKIFNAMGRSEVRAVVDGWIDEIVYGLVTLIHIFNPSDILLGGGILAQDYIIEEVRRKVMLLIDPNMRNVRIRQASLGNLAGLTGAAMLASSFKCFLKS